MRPRILLAVDDLPVRESLRKLLRSEQYDVVVPVPGKDRTDTVLADTSPFDLILTDLNMPLRESWASLDRLFEVNPLQAVVLLTGMPNQRELAETSHVRALVEKPVDVPALLRLIQDLLAEIGPCQLRRFPRGQSRFQHVPAYDGLSGREQINPYRSGLNE